MTCLFNNSALIVAILIILIWHRPCKNQMQANASGIQHGQKKCKNNEPSVTINVLGKKRNIEFHFLSVVIYGDMRNGSDITCLLQINKMHVIITNIAIIWPKQANFTEKVCFSELSTCRAACLPTNSPNMNNINPTKTININQSITRESLAERMNEFYSHSTISNYYQWSESLPRCHCHYYLNKFETSRISC